MPEQSPPRVTCGGHLSPDGIVTHDDCAKCQPRLHPTVPMVYFKGMAWPVPDGGLDDSIGYQLRYGRSANRQLCLQAASVVDACDALVAKSQRDRAEVIRVLRWAADEHWARARTDTEATDA